MGEQRKRLLDAAASPPIAVGWSACRGKRHAGDCRGEWDALLEMSQKRIA